MTEASEPEGVTGRLVTWIHELAWDDVPEEVRTHVELDRGIDELPPTDRFQTHVTLTFTDGSTESESVKAPHGNPLDPVTNEEIVAKFHTLADRVTTPERATAIVDAVLGLADAAAITPLVTLLAEPVGRAIG
ncbi:hypothetical protein [Kutzneria sp. NPDC052558]|uniref:hypothetical protein n=1 Tax=Kutzneria sp. NPDC052558 TaxID=3364121 RepID=UPI0037CB1CA3